MLETTAAARPACTIRKLAAHEHAGTAALLAAAFADNPCYAFMHPNEARRARDLDAFFRRNLAWHAPLELTWVVTEAGRPLATATLEPPGGVPLEARRALAIWLFPTLREQGFATLRRILRADQEFQRCYRELAGSEYWHVHAVAVAPDAQGRGVGSELMKAVLHELEKLRAARPAPVMLSTQRASNVRFYERFGFEVVGERAMGQSAGEPGFHSWFMRLRP
jgi:ribosomal protein S18 acetylase RimI-like enzyme